MSLIIRNVTILPSSDQSVRDIIIDKRNLAAIGAFPGKRAETTIDGRGWYAAPGFLDVASETDHHLDIFSHPEQERFIAQGVTGMICGQEGTSLAPLLYGSLESFEEWASPERLNVDWHGFGEFLARMKKNPLGVHFASYAGHSTIRRALVGDHVRDLTKNELDVLRHVADQSIAEGALGISCNLKSVYGRDTPYPELKMLAAVAKARNAPLSIGLRKATELERAADEVFRLARDTGARIIIANFLPIKGQTETYERILEKMEGFEGELDLSFELSPFEYVLRPLYRYLPDWAQTGSLATMRKNLADDWMRVRILKDMPPVAANEIFIAKAPGDHTVVGYTLRDYMDLYSIGKPSEALLKLMQATDLHAVLAHRSVDENMLARALSHPRSLIASKGVAVAPRRQHLIASPEDRTPTYARFIQIVLEKGLMSLGNAIRKITEHPAETLGITDRGIVAPGREADLTLFSLDGAIPKMETVIVGGAIAYARGEALHTRNGSLLRRT